MDIQINIFISFENYIKNDKMSQTVFDSLFKILSIILNLKI